MAGRLIFVAFACFLFLACFITISFGDESLVVVLSLDDMQLVSIQGNRELLNVPTPPGSTLKPFAAIAGFLSGFDPKTNIHCPGSTIDTRQAERCWLVSGHGKQNFIHAVGNSCSTYFRAMTANVNSTLFTQVLIDYKMVEPDTDLIDLSQNDMIGQTDKISIRPAALLAAYCMAFTSCPPFQFGKNQTIEKLNAMNKPPSAPYADQIKKGMHIGSKTGTFRQAMIHAPGMSVFGKTGTAPQIGSDGKKLQGLFVGFTPYPDPKFAVLVLVRPGKGGGTAAPIGIKALAEKAGYLKGER